MQQINIVCANRVEIFFSILTKSPSFLPAPFANSPLPFFFLHNRSLSEPPLYMNNDIMPYFAANHKRYVPGSTLAPV